MSGDPIERLSLKDRIGALRRELIEQYGLSPIAAKALIRRIQGLLEQVGASGAGVGQLQYIAVAQGELAGKPLRLCKRQPITLNWIHPDDARVLHEDGAVKLRHVRAIRMSRQAQQQGAALSQEDLALLLGVNISTIQRISARSRNTDAPLHTRGHIDDIGRGGSHKQQIIELFFRGKSTKRIAHRTQHSIYSVERYLSDFARVAELRRRNLSMAAIGRITGLSDKLIKDHALLCEQFKGPENKAAWDNLLLRFHPINPEQCR